MKRAIRWLLWSLFVLVLLFLLLLLVLRVRPQLAVSAANALQDAAVIEAPALTVQYWPLGLAAPSVGIVTATQQLAIEGLDMRADPTDWWQNRAFWHVSLDSLRIRQSGGSATGAVDPGVPSSADAEAQSPVALIDLRPYLTFRALEIGTLVIEGDSPLQVSFSATQTDEQIDLMASARIPSHELKLEGVITPTATALATELSFAVVPVDEAELRAQGTFAGALEVGERAQLNIRAGQATVNLGVDEHRLVIDDGRIEFGPSAAIDEVSIVDLVGRYENARWSEPLPVELSGDLRALNTEPVFDFRARVHQTLVNGSGRFDTAAERLSGAFELASEGVHADLPLSPFSAADLFPLSTSGDYTADAGSLALSHWVFDSPRNQFTGELNLGTTPALRVHGSLDAEQLFVPLVSGDEAGDKAGDKAGDEGAEVDAADEAAAIEEVADVDTDASGERLFSSEPLDWHWLDTADFAITLAAKRLAIQDAEFEDLRAALNSTSAGLELAPLSAVFGGGGFDGSLKLDRAAPLPKTLATTAAADDAAAEAGVDVTLAFELDGVALEAFGLVPKEELTGGELEVALALASTGASPAALAGALDGEVTLMAEDAKLMNDFIELAGSDLVMETLNKLNPFVRDDPSTELVCALAHFEVVDGVMTTKNELVIETSKMEIVGDGSVDLGEERISLTLSPNAKSGVGVNVGSLVKFLKLGGTLANPRPAADAAGLLKSGVAIGAAASTGGLSILADGLASRVLNAGSACVRFKKRADEPAAESADGQ